MSRMDELLKGYTEPPQAPTPPPKPAVTVQDDDAGSRRGRKARARFDPSDPRYVVQKTIRIRKTLWNWAVGELVRIGEKEEVNKTQLNASVVIDAAITHFQTLPAKERRSIIALLERKLDAQEG